MKLYVCWGTFGAPGHACARARDALVEAGHEPEVVKAYGWGALPDMPFNQTPGRRRAKTLTGSSSVPVLELDDGTAVSGSHEIAAWARAHGAAGATPA
jgi:hypothetical protein